jgi:ParB family chromosome partitioning protein
MARKNILAGLMDDSKKFVPTGSDPVDVPERQQLAYKGVGALGAVTRSIDALAAKAEAAKAIEQKLAEGETVVDLDTGSIEDSFVTDRLVQVDEQFLELVEAIRLRGQDSPILVRPHPLQEGRYQIVFGHRRARAARDLGRPVRAVVKRLSDRDHVIAQGQENSARADLSFIERTMFASRLEGLGFDRETIMSSLSADKTTVSKMLSVTKRIPGEVLATVEGARTIGRDRWHDLSARLEDEAALDRVIVAIGVRDFMALEPEKRFELLERLVKQVAPSNSPAPAKAEHQAWRHRSGNIKARFKDDGKQFTIALRDRHASAFGAYISSNLDRLFEAFEQERKSNETGD